MKLDEGGYCCDWCYQTPILGKRYVWKGKVTTDVCEACYKEFGNDPDMYASEDSSEDVVSHSMYALHSYKDGLSGPLALHQLNILTAMDMSKRIGNLITDTVVDCDKLSRIWGYHQTIRDIRAASLRKEKWATKSNVSLRFLYIIRVLTELCDQDFRANNGDLIICRDDAGHTRNVKIQNALAALSEESKQMMNLAKKERCCIRPKQWKDKISCIWNPSCMETVIARTSSEIIDAALLGSVVANEYTSQLSLGITHLAYKIQEIILKDENMLITDAIKYALPLQKSIGETTVKPVMSKDNGPNLLETSEVLRDNNFMLKGEEFIDMEYMPLCSIKIWIRNKQLMIFIDCLEVKMCELPEVEGCKDSMMLNYMGCKYNEGGSWKENCESNNCNKCDHDTKSNFLYVNLAIAMALCASGALRHEYGPLYRYRNTADNLTATYMTNCHWLHANIIIG